ncbi:MAG TPA: hypothetical protein VIY47_01575, partial [Ignavibacteriaceae bacterium]
MFSLHVNEGLPSETHPQRVFSVKCLNCAEGDNCQARDHIIQEGRDYTIVIKCARGLQIRFLAHFIAIGPEDEPNCSLHVSLF